MTNLELAQQQGNQAAPNLIEAALNGELGGSGSFYILPEQAKFVLASVEDYGLTSAQANEEAAQTIYDNFKIVNPKLGCFSITEVYTPESEEQEAQSFVFNALSQEFLDFMKNQLNLLRPIYGSKHLDEIEDVLNSITPDELFFSEDLDFSNVAAMFLNTGVGDLPPFCDGLVTYSIESPSGSGSLSDSYTYVGNVMVNPASLLMAVTHKAATILDTPVKLEKPVYETIFPH